jgi:uncharacterized protein (TIGR03437 family)
VSLLLVHLLLFVAPLFQQRAIVAANASIERNSAGTVYIEVDARGDENTFGTSINFDPRELVIIGAALAPGAPTGSSIFVNSSQSATGHLGIVVSMPIGQSVAAGHVRLVALTFHAREEGSSSSTSISFGDLPLARQVVKADATAIPFSSLAFVSGLVTLTRTTAIVSAASFLPGLPVAPLSIVSAFGQQLATGEASASTVPLPLQLSGTQARVRDAAGVDRPAQLFYAGPSQINFVMPEGTSSGLAALTITAGDGAVSTGTINVVPVSPAFFTSNSSGIGVPAGSAYRYRAGVLISEEAISAWDGARYVTKPIDLGPDTDQIFLVLYGTGFRFNTGLSAIQSSIAGKPITTAYAGSQGFFVGEDQVNLGPLPRTLSSAGVANLSVIVDGQPANVVNVEIK